MPPAGDNTGAAAGVCTTNAAPALATPFTVTTTLPVVAAAGTTVVICVADHAFAVAVTPLNFTVLVPCVDPKFVPVTVTGAPPAPLVGDSDVIAGGGTTVKVAVLLATPATVTLTAPVVVPVGTVATIDVFDQLVTVAVLLLKNVTVLFNR